MKVALLRSHLHLDYRAMIAMSSNKGDGKAALNLHAFLFLHFSKLLQYPRADLLGTDFFFFKLDSHFDLLNRSNADFIRPDVMIQSESIFPMLNKDLEYISIGYILVYISIFCKYRSIKIFFVIRQGNAL